MLVLMDIASAGFVRALFAKSAPSGTPVEGYTVSRMNGADSALSYSKLWVADTRRGPRGICLTVWDANVAAQAFYRKLGYRYGGKRSVVRRDWSAPYAEWLLMLKD
ncbi:hypothetical protein [Defluviimonas sp. WL0075]|uniref:N-acetyltransferase domain-containing protein n=1 Tax=Albidovulum sediminicola TaxID=2984331 RepID=A0ABT2Z4L3_9RHOB|nr:hypothetical protein [Defluviimonas sp. WL0075]MCV2866027.1 hypothetical protein [Defluviimonas sp. WL0075]